jgi:hypothetical protein
MADTQHFHADEATAANEAVATIRALLDGMPIAVAVSVVDTVKDDVHRQLQYGRSQFGLA